MRGLDRGGDAVDVDARARLARALSGFARRHPAQATEAAGFARLLEDRADPFVRERLEGHFTASAWLVDRTGSRTLLTHHRKLGRWLQPGGHADGDRDLARVALRGRRRSGLHGLRVEPAIFDLDRHWIPGIAGAGHWHYDVRYVVRAGDDGTSWSARNRWRWRGGIRRWPRTGADPSLRRMARRWLVERSPAPAEPAAAAATSAPRRDRPVAGRSAGSSYTERAERSSSSRP